MNRAFGHFRRVATMASPPRASEFRPPSLQTVAAFVAVAGSLGAGAFGLLSYFLSPITKDISEIKAKQVTNKNEADTPRLADLSRQDSQRLEDLSRQDSQRLEDLNRQNSQRLEYTERFDHDMQELRQQCHLDFTMVVGVMTNQSTSQKDIATLAAFVERVAPSQPIPKTDDKEKSPELGQ
jgi:hypothetical protein